MQRIEIFRASNGFALVVGKPETTEMLVFSEWAGLIEYLSSQAGLWGRRNITLEPSPNWNHAPKWATSWVNEAHWIGKGKRVEDIHYYSEERPAND